MASIRVKGTITRVQPAEGGELGSDFVPFYITVSGWDEPIWTYPDRHSPRYMVGDRVELALEDRFYRALWVKVDGRYVMGPRGR